MFHDVMSCHDEKSDVDQDKEDDATLVDQEADVDDVGVTSSTPG